MNKIPILLGVMLLGFACSSYPEKLSPVHRRALQNNSSAGKAFAEGNHPAALAMYGKSLRESRSIEDVDGIATSLINLAATYRAMEEVEMGHEKLNHILESTDVVFLPAHLAEAAYVAALLYLDSHSADRAALAVERALNHCREGGCGSEGKLYNLKARISLLNSNFQDGLSLAEKGLGYNRKYEDLNESANSLRLMGNAMKALKKHEKSRSYYLEALDIDRKLGLSSKIFHDLMGIGDTYFKTDRYEKALSFYRRALSVNENGSGSEEGRRRAGEMIRDCAELLKGD